MNIIAFDPGGTTGMAEVRISVEEGDDYQFRQIGSAREVWNVLNDHYPDQVIYEKFYYQRRDKVDLTPVEVIGVIKLWGSIHEVPVASYSAAQAKGFWSDQKLKQIQGWQEGMPHAMDALRHLLYHRVFIMKHDYILQGLRTYD